MTATPYPASPDRPTTTAGTEQIPIAPGRLPGLGHLLPLLRRPLAFMRSLAEIGEIVRIDLGTLPVYAVTSPHLVHRVQTANAAELDKGRLIDKARPLMGNGLVTSSGQFHRDQRRLVQPGFHPTRIAGYITTMSAVSERIAASWRPGQVVDVALAMDTLAITVAAETLFATHPGSKIITDISRDLRLVARGTVMRSLLPEWWPKLHTIGNRRYTAAAARLRATINAEITAHRSTGSDAGDILSALLAARDPDTAAGMTTMQITDEVTTLMLAGTETIRSTLMSVFAVLGQRPDIEQRLHAEVDQVLGQRPIEPDDLPQLSYTRNVLTETLRMYSVLFLMRRTQHPFTLGETTLPASTELLYSPYALHHDPRWYHDPDRFDPDRWLPDNSRPLPPGAFVPFAGGARKCIGDKFALTEATIALATIASRWQLRPHPRSTTRLIATPVVHPNRLRTIALPRHQRT